MRGGRIRRSGAVDATAILGVSGDAAEAYRGVIPEDRREETSVVLADRRWRRQLRTGIRTGTQ